MFSAYDAPRSWANTKRLVVAAVAAAGVLVAAAVTAVTLANRPSTVTKEKSVDVSFRPPPPPPPVAKIENAPPPAPKRLAAPKPAAVVAAPVAPPPPAPAAAPMTAPKEMPKGPAPESNQVVAARAVAVGGSGDGSGTAVGGPPTVDESPAPVEAHASRGGPINLPEEADPPEPDEDNPPPEYPESARASGQEARVVVKVVVQTDGRVGPLHVLKGEEPFLSAAIAAVKAWRFSPAMLDGHPIAVFLTIPMKFSLRE